MNPELNFIVTIMFWHENQQSVLDWNQQSALFLEEFLLWS